MIIPNNQGGGRCSASANTYRDLYYSGRSQKPNLMIVLKSYIVFRGKKRQTHHRTEHGLTLLMEIMHRARSLKNSDHLFASR